MSDRDKLELKKRARRRLVGAAALAVVAAIVLPMVMDDEPEAPLREIQVTIPERGGESQPIGARQFEGAPFLVPPPREEAVTMAEGGELAADAVTAEPEPESAPAEAASFDAPAGSQAEAAPGDSAPQPDDGENGEAARVRAILEGRAELAAAGEPQRERFAVQVGAFSNADKAQALRHDLGEKGFDAFTVAGDSITRVRVGLFASRKEAESAAGQLRSLGIEGVVIQSR